MKVPNWPSQNSDLNYLKKESPPRRPTYCSTPKQTCHRNGHKSCGRLSQVYNSSSSNEKPMSPKTIYTFISIYIYISEQLKSDI